MPPMPRPVPYGMLSPGFEAIYTGGKAESGAERQEGPMTLLADAEGNEIRRWSVWTWTWPGQEGRWGPEIRRINAMQSALGPLDDETRRLRAHVGSLVLCEAGFPVTVDDLLAAIGRGRFAEPPLHDGCWCAGMWWECRGTQWGHCEAMAAIETCVREYVAGEPADGLGKRFPHAAGFVCRMAEWLGPADKLTELQRLMLARMLLPFDHFTGRNESYQEVNRDCFEEGGRGRQIDERISALAGLPKVHFRHTREFRDALASIEDPVKRDLYDVHSRIANGVHGLSACHHATFRYIETWLHGIGIGKASVPTRRPGSERERLGRLLFGYALALDKWLLRRPMQFLLLDLGHVDIGFDPRNEILRVYAHLGEERTPVKQWLAACLWHNLVHNDHGGLRHHREIPQTAADAGLSIREWMDAELAAGEEGRAEE